MRVVCDARWDEIVIVLKRSLREKVGVMRSGGARLIGLKVYNTKSLRIQERSDRDQQTRRGYATRQQNVNMTVKPLETTRT